MLEEVDWYKNELWIVWEHRKNKVQGFINGEKSTGLLGVPCLHCLLSGI